MSFDVAPPFPLATPLMLDVLVGIGPDPKSSDKVPIWRWKAHKVLHHMYTGLRVWDGTGTMGCLHSSSCVAS